MARTMTSAQDISQYLYIAIVLAAAINWKVSLKEIKSPILFI